MEVILFIGIQASGKSTFFQTHFVATHEYISKDVLRNNKKPARRQQQLLAEALQTGHSVVIDNTNPTREEREEIIQLAHQYGASVIGYYFEAQVKQSLERNRAREGKARVPDIAIFATLKRLARPSYTEGFDQLFYVRTMGDQTFAISDWKVEFKDG
ncbi:MAG TPA: ATP-binding protein [Dictyobacter sp.]|jgi:predicted kinase|nr:ATP-binding protein [Dictyobacter sp.]